LKKVCLFNHKNGFLGIKKWPAMQNLTVCLSKKMGPLIRPHFSISQVIATMALLFT
jgi:hypothetical protein